MRIPSVRFVLTASALLVTAAATAQDAQRVRIAHVGPLSGGVEHQGKDSENGVRMAIAELNARQPVIGGRAVRFELAAEDDAGHPTQATIVAQRLCDFGIAGVVGHLQSGTTLPASDVYQRCGLPHITPAATNPEVTARGHATTFRVIANDNALGAALALYAADVLKLRRVAVIDDRTAYGKTVADVFRATAESHGMEVVATEFTKDSATDFMAILTNIRAAQPQAIFYGGLDAQAGPLLRQMDQLGMSEVRVLAGDGACTEKLPEMAGHTPAVARVVCATGGVAVNRMPGGSAWRQRYEERFPGQFQTFSPYAYDATMVLADAMRRANSVDPKVYLPALRQTDHQGVTARIRFNSQGDLTQPAVTLNAYRNNVRTPLN